MSNNNISDVKSTGLKRTGEATPQGSPKSKSLHNAETDKGMISPVLGPSGNVSSPEVISDKSD